MRIDVFFDAFPHPAKPNLETQLLEWQRQGHQIRVYSLARIGRASSAFPVSVIQKLRQRPVRLSLGTMWRFFTRPRRALRIWAHRHSLRNAAQLLVRDAQLSSDPPDVYFIHNLTAAVSFSYLRNAVPTVPLAVYYHGGELPGVPQIAPEAARRALQCADMVFSNTQASINEVIARGAAPGRTSCAPTSFALERFPRPDRRDYLPRNRWRFVCVGRLAPEKGFDVALRAFAELHQHTSAFDVTFIGNGPEYENLKDLTNQLKLQDSVRFLGHVDSQRLIPLLADFDAFVLSSRPIAGSNWSETQAAVMQEAMLMGTVVIASDLGGVRESLPSVLHPYLYAPGSTAELLMRLLSITSIQTTELQTLSESARQFVIENYDIRKVNKRLLTRLASLRSDLPSLAQPITHDEAVSPTQAGEASKTTHRR